jgi:hypothetical protein
MLMRYVEFQQKLVSGVGIAQLCATWIQLSNEWTAFYRKTKYRVLRLSKKLKMVIDIRINKNSKNTVLVLRTLLLFITNQRIRK